MKQLRNVVIKDGKVVDPGKEVDDLQRAVLEYLSECDNPVPDASDRRVLRNRLRTMVGAPAEPPSEEHS